MAFSLRNHLNVPNVISLLALIVAAISLVTTYRLTHLESERAKKEQLRVVISALLDVRKDLTVALETGEKPYYDLYFERRQIQFETAEEILQQIPDKVSWAEYNTLAKESIFDENFERAFDYLKVSQANASGIRPKVYSLNALAYAYFIDSPLRNYEKGRSAFRDAIRVLESTREPYYASIISGTYETWAEAETDAGFQREALDLLSRAEKYARDISSDDPTREYRLKRIAESVSQLTSTTKAKQNRNQ
jgi:predicted metal-dependent hydrolase